MPHLPNYLEIVGGTNFGVQSGNDPDWHSTNCAPNLSTGIPNTDNPASSKICLIANMGTNATTPAVDVTNEVQGAPGQIDRCDGRPVR